MSGLRESWGTNPQTVSGAFWGGLFFVYPDRSEPNSRVLRAERRSARRLALHKVQTWASRPSSAEAPPGPTSIPPCGQRTGAGLGARARGRAAARRQVPLGTKPPLISGPFPRRAVPSQTPVPPCATLRCRNAEGQPLSRPPWPRAGPGSAARTARGVSASFPDIRTVPAAAHRAYPRRDVAEPLPEDAACPRRSASRAAERAAVPPGRRRRWVMAGGERRAEVGGWARAQLPWQGGPEGPRPRAAAFAFRQKLRAWPLGRGAAAAPSFSAAGGALVRLGRFVSTGVLMSAAGELRRFPAAPGERGEIRFACRQVWANRSGKGGHI